MSSIAVSEIERPAQQIAEELNSDFQFVADHLPTEVKEASPQDGFTLSALDGIGLLWAKYVRPRPDRTGEAQLQFLVRIGVLAEAYDGRMDIDKEFGLTYQTLHREGPLDDIQPFQAHELMDCPISLEVLAFAVKSLRKDFETTYALRPVECEVNSEVETTAADQDKTAEAVVIQFPVTEPV